MKAIKTHADLEVLRNEAIPEKVKNHVDDYFNKMIEVFGGTVDPQESGWIILLEKGDPLNDLTFLEESLGIRGGRNLVTIIKEFVDYDTQSNLFDVFVLFNDNFGMTFLIPNEAWIGEALLHQLKAFENYQGNCSGK